MNPLPFVGNSYNYEFIDIPSQPKWIFSFPCTNWSHCYPYNFSINSGIYKLEVWGAQGGNTSEGRGGHGGYSSGILFAQTQINLYIYVGGGGSSSSEIGNQLGGYNGGGIGQREPTYYGSGGGGASDIRINQDSLFNRVIVAGGGGGAGYGKNSLGSVGYHLSGGYAGGVSGRSGIFSEVDLRSFNVTGGTQNQYGQITCIPVSGAGCHDTERAHGEFGYGGDSPQVFSGWSSAGGGGGWYGGAAGVAWGASGAGGSGYVHNVHSYKPNGYLLSSTYYLTNTTMLSGNDSMPSPYSDSTQIGHQGNGCARITLLQNLVPKNINTICNTLLSSSIFHLLFVLSIFPLFVNFVN